MPRSLLLAKALEHHAHHEGQAAVYLRLAGITPPSQRLFRVAHTTGGLVRASRELHAWRTLAWLDRTASGSDEDGREWRAERRNVPRGLPVRSKQAFSPPYTGSDHG